MLLKDYFNSFEFEENEVIFASCREEEYWKEISPIFSKVLKESKKYLDVLDEHPKTKKEEVNIIPRSVNPWRHFYRAFFYKDKEKVIVGMQYGEYYTSWRIVIIPLSKETENKVILLVPRKDGGFTPYTFRIEDRNVFYQDFYIDGNSAPDFESLEDEVVFLTISVLRHLNIYPKEEWARKKFIFYKDSISTRVFIEEIDDYKVYMNIVLKDIKKQSMNIK